MNSFKLLIVLLLLFSSNLYANEKKELPIIKYGLVTYYDVFSNFKDTKDSFANWLEQLGIKKGAKLKTIMYDDIDQLFSDYLDGKLDIVSLNFNDYFLRREKIKKISNRYWSVSYNDKNEYKYCLAVRNDIKFNSFNDLKDKKIIMKEHENIGRIWLDYNTTKNLNKDFTDLVDSIKYEPKESTSLLNVYFKKEDIALIQKQTWEVMLELNPAIKHKIKLFKCSKMDFLPFISFFSKKTDNIKSEIFYNAILDRDDKEMGNLFELFDFNKMYKLDKENIITVEKFYEDYYNLKKKYK